MSKSQGRESRYTSARLVNFSASSDGHADSSLNHPSQLQDLLSEVWVERQSSDYPVSVFDVGFLQLRKPYFLQNSGVITLSAQGPRFTDLGLRKEFYTDYESLHRVVGKFEKNGCHSVSFLIDELSEAVVKLPKYMRYRNRSIELVAHCPITASVFTLKRLPRCYDHLVLHIHSETLPDENCFLIEKLMDQGARLSFFIKNLDSKQLERLITKLKLYDQNYTVIYSPPVSAGLKLHSGSLIQKLTALGSFYRLPLVWI